MQGYPNVSPPAPPKEGHKSGHPYLLCLRVVPHVPTKSSFDHADQKIDYVFVDEHNRHKRLKGMDLSLH